MPTLSNFLENDFSPYVDARHKAKPATAECYHDGEKMLNKCDCASLKLDAISISTRKDSPRSSPSWRKASGNETVFLPMPNGSNTFPMHRNLGETLQS